MKTYQLKYLMLVLVLYSTACKKKEVDPVYFDVTVPKNTYKIGDTVRFQISGNPDYISYYPGDNGFNYDFSNIANRLGKVTMSFSSRLTQGTTDPTQQQNTLSVLVSDHFVTPTPGFLIDSTNITGAPANTWTNITNRFTLPTTPSNNTIPSGTADITDIATAAGDKPVYVAFKYNDVSSPTYAQRSWTITNLTVDNTLPNGQRNNGFVLIASSANQLFTVVNVKNPTNKWSVASSSAQVSFTGGPIGAADNEDWVVSRPIYLSAFPKDVAIPVKTISDNPVNSLNKVYTTAGTYNVVFVAKSQNIYSSSPITKMLTITVTP